MIEKFLEQYANKAAFCKAVGIRHMTFLNQIIAKKRPIPPKVCLKLNELHGADLHALRPDVYPKQ